MFKKFPGKMLDLTAMLVLLTITGCATPQPPVPATFQIKRVEPPNEFLVTKEGKPKDELFNFDELATRYTLQEEENSYIITGKIEGYEKERIRIMINEVMAQITLAGDPCKDDITAFPPQDSQKSAAEQDTQRFLTQNVYRRRVTNINGKISVEECGEAHTAIPFPGLVIPDAATAQITDQTLMVTVPKKTDQKFEYKTIPVR
jgi:HSP20 family molecular chaperone IbpA